jgi:hypothetical protein
VLACWFGVDRSTITRAIGEVRPLLAERGFVISPGARLRTLAEVVDHLGTSGKTGIIAGTEIRVRRPAAGRRDQDKFISGKSEQNAVKTVAVTDGDGRVLFCSPAQHGSCADITHARQLGLVRLLDRGPALELLADAGYQGPGSPDRRARGDATAPQVQEERPGLVRGDTRAPSQGPLLPTHPRRARHRTLERTGGPWPATSAAANTSATWSKPLPDC